jgi:hypothetical protein
MPYAFPIGYMLLKFHGFLYITGGADVSVRAGWAGLQLLYPSVHQLLGSQAAPAGSHRGEKLRVRPLRTEIHPVQQLEQTSQTIHMCCSQTLDFYTCPYLSACVSFFVQYTGGDSSHVSNFFQDFAHPGYVAGEGGVDEGSRFVCQLCGKGFKHKWNLTQHMPVHTGERNYVCGCGKKFTQSGSLYKHSKNSCVFRK